jgi:hypothetical protein
MGAADWIDTPDSLSTASVLRTVTAGFPPPPGGGIFTYGFNSLDATPGVVARYCTLSGSDPSTSGGDISAAMMRASQSVSPTGFAPFLFFCLGGTDASDDAYILGLADGNPPHIVLRKGALSGGLPDGPPAPTSTGVLGQSTDTFLLGTWYQIKLEVVVNLNGDVVLNCYSSDLTANLVSAPVWTSISGLPQFVDDALGINSGSLPYTSGRMGYGFVSSATGMVAFFDEIQPDLQI